MLRSRKDNKGGLAPSSRKQIFVGLGFLAVLTVVILTSYGGLMGFFKAVSEERNLSSIALLMSFIAVLFVLLHRLGIGIDQEEEIETVLGK